MPVLNLLDGKFVSPFWPPIGPSWETLIYKTTAPENSKSLIYLSHQSRYRSYNTNIAKNGKDRWPIQPKLSLLLSFSYLSSYMYTLYLVSHCALSLLDISLNSITTRLPAYTITVWSYSFCRDSAGPWLTVPPQTIVLTVLIRWRLLAKCPPWLTRLRYGLERTSLHFQMTSKSTLSLRVIYTAASNEDTVSIEGVDLHGVDDTEAELRPGQDHENQQKQLPPSNSCPAAAIKNLYSVAVEMSSHIPVDLKFEVGGTIWLDGHSRLFLIADEIFAASRKNIDWT